MNIFVTDSCPERSAVSLPDKHIVKMPLESCQMLSILASKWYHNYGPLPKRDGGEYSVDKGAHRNHPCTKWAAKSNDNAFWLINHGLALCKEYTFRYNKTHSCEFTLNAALSLFPKGDLNKVTDFVRAMPDEIKLDDSIDTFSAYRKYINTKPWVSSNYVRKPERKPEWIN